MRCSTIYEINKLFTQGISLFYSASYGSLQFSLNKLLNRDYIEIINQEASGRKKKVYGITYSGRSLFLDWMINSEIRPEHIDPTALTNVYFLGLIDNNDTKRAIISKIITAYTIQEQVLSKIEQDIKTYQILNELQPVFKYQIATLHYGTAMQQQAKQWYINLLHSIDNKNRPLDLYPHG